MANVTDEEKMFLDWIKKRVRSRTDDPYFIVAVYKEEGAIRAFTVPDLRIYMPEYIDLPYSSTTEGRELQEDFFDLSGKRESTKKDHGKSAI